MLVNEASTAFLCDEGQKQPKAAVTAASMAAEGPLHESGDAAVSLVLR